MKKINKKILLIASFFTSAALYSADNEIYIEQSGATANIDVEQLGISNFTGSTNLFTIQVDPSNTYGADSSNHNVAVTGAGNTFTLNQGTSAMAATLDLDWIIQGSNNTITSNINIDGATQYVDIDGSDNTLTYTGTGVTASAGGYFYLDQTGGSRTFNIQQLSTQDNDWLKILSTGSSGTICVIQNDQGTSLSC